MITVPIGTRSIRGIKCMMLTDLQGKEGDEELRDLIAQTTRHVLSELAPAAQALPEISHGSMQRKFEYRFAFPVDDRSMRLHFTIEVTTPHKVNRDKREALVNAAADRLKTRVQSALVARIRARRKRH